jgi:hypothetical protein
VTVTQIHSRQTSLTGEQISRSIDLSMGRSDAPIGQGDQDARQAMA